MLVITGASGHLGRLVIESLLRRGIHASRIVAAVRSPGKAQDLAGRGVLVREADYDKPETLAKAFTGAERVLLISSSEPGKRQEQHQAVIRAARQQGAQQIVYTSLLHADRSPLTLVAADHVATEQALRASGMRHTILRNGWYHENYLQSLRGALEHGEFIGASADGLIASAARADYAEAAAVVLTAPIVDARTFELAGDLGYSMQELAQTLSLLTGRAVRYRDMQPQAYAQTLASLGVPAAFVPVLANAEAGAARGGLFDSSRTLSQLIHRPTMPMAEFIRQHFCKQR